MRSEQLFTIAILKNCNIVGHVLQEVSSVQVIASLVRWQETTPKFGNAATNIWAVTCVTCVAVHETSSPVWLHIQKETETLDNSVCVC